MFVMSLRMCTVFGHESESQRSIYIMIRVGPTTKFRFGSMIRVDSSTKCHHKCCAGSVHCTGLKPSTLSRDPIPTPPPPGATARAAESALTARPRRARSLVTAACAYEMIRPRPGPDVSLWIGRGRLQQMSECTITNTRLFSC